MHRFFLPPSAIQDQSVSFPEETARQIQRVLRLKPGDEVIVLDGLGDQYRVLLDMPAPREVTGQVLAREPASGEPATRLALLVGLTQREKFEWILQKGTEVGVAEFVPFISSRSLVQEPEKAGRKLERWSKIVQEAAEQSSRGRVPPVREPVSYSEALVLAAANDLALAAWEGEQATTLRQAIPAPAPRRAALLIGPEGGLSLEEIEAARRAGWTSVSLGERILRMETAAVVGSALVLYECERVGS